MICDLLVVTEGLMLPMLENAIRLLHAVPVITAILRKQRPLQLD